MVRQRDICSENIRQCCGDADKRVSITLLHHSVMLFPRTNELTSSRLTDVHMENETARPQPLTADFFGVIQVLEVPW